MLLEHLGYNIEFESYRKENELNSFQVGRIISEHKERYIVRTENGEFQGEIIGNLRFTAKSRADFPAVGDWVAVTEIEEDKVLIYSIYPRKTVLERLAIGKQSETQIIASNIDYALIVLAADRDFNINRIERYLTICNTAKVTPILILNKIDLCTETQLKELLKKIENRLSKLKVIPISNYTKLGIEQIEKHLQKANTYCLLGSSGVGKSSLLNNLLHSNKMQTSEISESNHKGKHTTSHRELFILNNGAILIDNPGMREVGIMDANRGLESTFDLISELEKNCRYNNCTHTSENGCAVIYAVENGELDSNSYKNYLKMNREKEFYESSIAERRKKDKAFGKLIKSHKKHR